MPKYVDGYVIPIKKKNVAKYKKMAAFGCKVWMKHGALSYYETIGDDYVAHGLGFKKMCKLKADETFVFAFIVYKSKAHRNKVNKKVMAEMKEVCGSVEMPFEMKRFSMAGCRVLVHSR